MNAQEDFLDVVAEAETAIDNVLEKLRARFADKYVAIAQGRNTIIIRVHSIMMRKVMCVAEQDSDTWYACRDIVGIYHYPKMEEDERYGEAFNYVFNTIRRSKYACSHWQSAGGKSTPIWDLSVDHVMNIYAAHKRWLEKDSNNISGDHNGAGSFDGRGDDPEYGIDCEYPYNVNPYYL